MQKSSEKHLVSRIEIEITADKKYFYRRVKTPEGIVYEDKHTLNNYVKVKDLIQQIDAFYCLPPQSNNACNCRNNRGKSSRFLRKIRAKFLQLQIQFFKVFG